ncbi:MAG: hypothetical protein ACQEP8_00060 [Chlamydiota bacterium]
MRLAAILMATLVLTSCSGLEDSQYKKIRKNNRITEPITRNHDDQQYKPPMLVPHPRNSYPWEQVLIGNHPKITKEYFRCQGNPRNKVIVFKNDNGDLIRREDCQGPQGHSLPLREGKEFIYPILTDILNYLQEATHKKVVVTCGHRCPQHNTYVDDSSYNRTSKHMIGAEVDFYVEGLEDDPQKVVDLIFEFFRSSKDYQSDSRYTEFERYTKPDTNVSTPPWYNREVFIKLFQDDEGRDLDNDHPYPYISIQVRRDRDTDKRVYYNWEQAFYNYLRW